VLSISSTISCPDPTSRCTANTIANSVNKEVQCLQREQGNAILTVSGRSILGAVYLWLRVQVPLLEVEQPARAKWEPCALSRLFPCNSCVIPFSTYPNKQTRQPRNATQRVSVPSLPRPCGASTFTDQAVRALCGHCTRAKQSSPVEEQREGSKLVAAPFLFTSISRSISKFSSRSLAETSSQCKKVVREMAIWRKYCLLDQKEPRHSGQFTSSLGFL
jgi:hypothetical protein